MTDRVSVLEGLATPRNASRDVQQAVLRLHQNSKNLETRLNAIEDLARKAGSTASGIAAGTIVIQGGGGGGTGATGPVQPEPGGGTPNGALDVTGLQLQNFPGTEFTGRDPQFVWDNGHVPSYLIFKDYQVVIIDPSTSLVMREEFVYTPFFLYNYEKNVQDSLVLGYPGPLREFTIKVWQRTTDGEVSAHAAALTVSNPAPALPATVNHQGFFTGLEIRFDRPTDPDFTSTQVYVNGTTGFTPGAGNLFYDGPETNPIEVSGLTPGTTVFFRIALTDSFGQGSISAEYTDTLGVVPGHDTTPPSVPGVPVLTASIQQSELIALAALKIDWAASTDDSGHVSYEVQYWTSAAPTLITTDTPQVNTDTVFPVQIRQTYNVRVRAVDFSGNVSAYSATATLLIAGDGVAPANVTGASAVGGLDKVILNWTNPADADFITVEVNRGTSSGFTPNAGTVIANGRSNSLIDAAVVNNTAYYYKFRTQDVSGNFSAFTSAVGPATPFSINSANIANYVDALAIGNAYIQNLDASKITTGFLDAARINAGTITAVMLNVTTLSSITGNFGSMTSGLITGVVIRTGAGNPKAQMDSTNGFTTFNSAGTQTARLAPDGSGFLGLGSPISWTTAGVVTVSGNLITTGTIVGPLFKTSTSGLRVEIGAQVSSVGDIGHPTTYLFVYRNNPAGSQLFYIDQSGGMYLNGSIVQNTGGSLRSGKTTGADTVNAGYFLGNTAGTPVFMIGNAGNTKSLQWDGTTLAINGGAVSSGTITAAAFTTAASGKRIEINSTVANEMHFFGDRGDGTVVDLCSIGVGTGAFASGTVLVVGTSVSTRQAGYFLSAITGAAGSNATLHAVYAGAVTTCIAVRGEGGVGVGVSGASTGGANGVSGTSVTGYGVFGVSVSGTTAVAAVRGSGSASAGIGVRGDALYGGYFIQAGGATVGGSLLLEAGANNTSAPSHAAKVGAVCIRFIAGVATLYVQSAGGFGGTGGTVAGDWKPLN